jgi:hypothetical protein
MDFGLWKVVGFHGYVNRNAYWNCVCRCGLEKEVKAQFLKSGSSRKCQTCAKEPREWKSVPPSRWSRILRNAEKRNIQVEISADEAWAQFILQEKNCALSGLPLELNGRSKCSASLDRIDSTRGYAHGNVQWVHRDINMMKHVFDQQHFVEMCRLVAIRDDQRSGTAAVFSCARQSRPD